MVTSVYFEELTSGGGHNHPVYNLALDVDEIILEENIICGLVAGRLDDNIVPWMKSSTIHWVIITVANVYKYDACYFLKSHHLFLFNVLD